MHKYLYVLTNIILHKYFSGTNCIFIFTDDDTKFNYKGPLLKVNLNVTSFNEDVFDKYFGCLGFIIISKTPCTIFRNIENAMKNTDARFNERKYLIIPDGYAQINNNPNCMFQLQEIYYVDDILIVIPHQETDAKHSNQFTPECNVHFDLLTHKYVGNYHNETILLDKWFSVNQSFLHNNNLYPDKIKDQQGRKLRLATFTYRPYSIPGMWDGTDMRVALLYSKLHNMSIELVIDEAGEWGTINNNWTGKGIVGNLVMDKGDIGFAGLYTWLKEHVYLDLSRSFCRAGVTCLAPAPRLAGGWMTPVLAFSSELWMGVGITFVFVIITFIATSTFLQKYKLSENCHEEGSLQILDESLFTTLSIFVVQSIPNTPLLDNGLFRYILGLVLIFALLLSSSYSSGLASNMTVPRYVGDIQTVENLVQSGFSWGGSTVDWVQSIEDATIPNIAILNKRFKFYKGEALRVLAYTNNYAFALERLPEGQYAFDQHIGENEVKQLKLMKEDLYYEYVVYMTRKSSILLPSFNDLIIKVFESGLLKTWEFEVAMKTTDSKVQRAIKYSRHLSKPGPTTLKISHLAGAFALLVLGLVLSCVIFICEKVFHIL